jgi:hypothetical protein
LACSRLAAVSIKESAHTAHASQEAKRWLAPRTPRPCSIALSVTTPRYSTIVSQTLRRTLRASFSERRSAELTKIHLPIAQAMYARIRRIGRGFFSGGMQSRGSLTYFSRPTSPRRSGDEAKQCPQRRSEPFCRGGSERPGLDPACGSGNLLSVSMQQLINSKREVITFAAEVGLPTFFPKVGPEQVSRGRGRAPS